MAFKTFNFQGASRIPKCLGKWGFQVFFQVFVIHHKVIYTGGWVVLPECMYLVCSQIQTVTPESSCGQSYDSPEGDMNFFSDPSHFESLPLEWFITSWVFQLSEQLILNCSCNTCRTPNVHAVGVCNGGLSERRHWVRVHVVPKHKVSCLCLSWVQNV